MFRVGAREYSDSLFVVVFWIFVVIPQAEKFLKCDWLRPVVFKPNLKYLHVKITPVT